MKYFKIYLHVSTKIKTVRERGRITKFYLILDLPQKWKFLFKTYCKITFSEAQLILRYADIKEENL